MAKTLIVEGWRFLPHSYAVVNQWQLLALKRRGDVEIKFVNVPYYNPKWQRQGGLFDREQEDLLQSIPIARSGECADVSFRLSFPYDFTPSPSAQTVVYGTLEFQAVFPEHIATAEAYEQARPERDDPCALVTESTASPVLFESLSTDRQGVSKAALMRGGEVGIE